MFSLHMSRKLYGRIDSLMKLYGENSITEHIRWALAIFEALLEYRHEGWTIMLERENVRREYIIPYGSKPEVDDHKIIYFKNYRDKEEEDT